MNGPTDDVRADFFGRLQELDNFRDGERVITPEIESQLDGLLIDLERQVEADLETSELARRDQVSPEDAQAMLMAVDQWASVASYCVAWVYAPQSPLPKRFAGWAACIAEQLRKIANRLRGALSTAARSLGAESWSIGVQFPWGVSVGLTWA